MRKLNKLLFLLLSVLCLTVTAFAAEAKTEVTAIKSTQFAQSEENSIQLQSDDCYFDLADNCYELNFVRNSTATIDFVLSGTRTDYYVVTALVDAYSNVYMTTEDRLSDYNIEPGYEIILTLTIDLDYSIPVGSYYLLFGIVDANSDAVYGIYEAEFNVVYYSKPVTGVSICDPYSDYQSLGQLTVCPDNPGVVAATFSPVGCTGYNEVVFTSSDENFFTVETWAGLGYVTAVSPGRATLTVTVNGKVTSSIPVLVGHKINEITYQEPVCEIDGIKTCFCEYCSYKYDEFIPATGHNYEEREMIPATCTTPGKITLYCKSCFSTKEEELPIDPDAHVYSEDEMTVLTAPTACKPGEGTKHCVLCDHDIPLTIPALFTDTQSGRFYSNAVDHFYSTGIINGMNATEFGTDTPLSRGMLVTFLYRLAGKPDCDATTPFTDVDDGRYFTTPIAWAYSTGIAKGTTDTTFEPMTDVTREELAAFLYRYGEYRGLSLTVEADLNQFPDASQLHNYAKTYVSWAVSANIISGSSDNGVVTLMPRGTATRAQAATMLYRYLSFEASQPEAPDESETPGDPEIPDDPVVPDDTQNPGDSEASGDQDTVLDMVWVPTHGGKRYHTVQDCGGMKNPKYIPLEDAIAQGFTPCKNCVHSS